MMLTGRLSMPEIPRRTVLESAGAAALVTGAGGLAEGHEQTLMQSESTTTLYMLGAYGKWAAEAVQDPPRDWEYVTHCWPRSMPKPSRKNNV
jgi:hypothetical protein